ncbi:alcohol dehydrogenase catalytic domain-containing protein [Microbacterium gorillae]|uniref:alcohol dehydrogenase catalytic domain-containing protein n=1 Tax=Microbacterium gorillae TaxID=1231063 RepID=UPI000693BEBB|nr:alcohol dehydrogenase catalytic domain-containing protein [Microbacterium gorillae]
MVQGRAALVSERGGSVTVAAVRVRPPGPGEVLVRIAASGVCPTDLFGIAGGAGERFPGVFGHEGAGTIERVGADVTDLAAGDRVVLSFASCGTCPACRNGHPASCRCFAQLNHAHRSDAEAASGPLVTGWMSQSSWATHVVVPASSAVVIDDDIPWAVAATFGCGVLTGAGTVLNVLRPDPDDALLVIGAGTTGLSAILAAAHRGVRRIVVVEPLAERRDLARELGATGAWDPAELSGMSDVTHAIDTVGSQEAISAALGAIGPGGVVATVALRPGANDMLLSQSRLLRGRAITGVIEGDADTRRDVPLLAALWRAGRLPVQRFITTYDFTDVDRAVEDLRAGRVIKPVLLLGEDGAREPVAPVAPEALSQDDLARLWRSLPAVAPRELRGLWRGRGLSPDHPAHRLLEGTRWYGKRFIDDDHVIPLVCRRPDGSLSDEADTARLFTAVHDGLTTAAMAYDSRPIIDLFARLDADRVLGVMTGRRAAGPDGRFYHFVLERVADG